MIIKTLKLIQGEISEIRKVLAEEIYKSEETMRNEMELTNAVFETRLNLAILELKEFKKKIDPGEHFGSSK